MNVLAATASAFYVDTLDLYAARPRAAFVTQTAAELALPEDVIKRDLGRCCCKLKRCRKRSSCAR